MLIGGSLCAVAAGQVEIWLSGIGTFDVTTVAAVGGAILASVAVARYRGLPITYGSVRFRCGRDLRVFRSDSDLIIGRDGPKGSSSGMVDPDISSRFASRRFWNTFEKFRPLLDRIF